MQTFLNQRILKPIGIMAFSLLLIACPYNSEIPLSTPQEKIPTQLIGKWFSEKDLNNEVENEKLMPENRSELTPTYYKISAIDEFSIRIEKHEIQISDSTYQIKLHTAHITKISDFTFLNIKPSDENKFYFYKVEFPDNKSVVLHPVSDYIKETFTDSNEMRSFFDKNKSLSFFYGAKEEYKKR